MSSLPNGAEGPNVVNLPPGGSMAFAPGTMLVVDADGEIRPLLASSYAMTANPIAEALRAMTLGLKAAWKANKSSIPDWRVRALPVGMILQILAWVLPFIVAWLQRNPAQLPALMAAGPREIPQAMYAAVAEGEGQS